MCPGQADFTIYRRVLPCTHVLCYNLCRVLRTDRQGWEEGGERKKTVKVVSAVITPVMFCASLLPASLSLTDKPGLLGKQWGETTQVSSARGWAGSNSEMFCCHCSARVQEDTEWNMLCIMNSHRKCLMWGGWVLADLVSSESWRAHAHWEKREREEMNG